jgi:cysteine synthase A
MELVGGSSRELKVDHSNGVFHGPSAVKDFLDPSNNPPLPLVELPGSLNPYREFGVRIYAKLMYLLPLLTIKSLPALNMLMDGHCQGKLKDVDTIVENSSGNTALSLAVMARNFGIERVVAMVPWDIAPGKLELLRLCGVDPRLQREAAGELSGIELARKRGSEAGNFSPCQYENEANPAAYEKWMAPEIWEQTQNALSVFAVGLGTSGTLVGASRYFRRQPAKIAIVGVICKADNAVPGVRTAAKLKEVGFDWRGAADCIVEAGTKESFRYSLRMCRAGFMAGPSSGFALAGLLRYLERAKNEAGFDGLRNKDGEVYAVFICGDTPLPYLDKYSTHLDATDF